MLSRLPLDFFFSFLYIITFYLINIIFYLLPNQRVWQYFINQLT